MEEEKNIICFIYSNTNVDGQLYPVLWCLTFVSLIRSVRIPNWLTLWTLMPANILCDANGQQPSILMPANLEYCDAWHSCLVEDQLPVSERQNPLSNPLIVNLRCRQTVNFYAREPPHDCDAWHLCLVDQLWIGRVPVNTSTMVKTCGHASEQ